MTKAMRASSHSAGLFTVLPFGQLASIDSANRLN